DRLAARGHGERLLAQVLAAADHRVAEVDPGDLDPDHNLGGRGRRHGDALEAQDLRAPEGVEHEATSCRGAHRDAILGASSIPSRSSSAAIRSRSATFLTLVPD